MMSNSMKSNKYQEGVIKMMPKLTGSHEYALVLPQNQSNIINLSVCCVQHSFSQAHYTY